MSEETFKRYKSRPKVVMTKPITGLKCPACKGNTVQRDVSPEDHYYVEFCIGGTVFVTRKDKDGKERQVPVDCEYWGVGWEGGKRK